MKVYSEEQAKYFFECGRNYQNNAEITFQVAKEEMPFAPIELPSDEEIKQEADSYHGLESYNTTFVQGAKWMRNKIQGGNNE